MAAADNDGSGGQCWQWQRQRGQRTTKAAVDDDMQDQAADYKGKEEGGGQTTTASGQPVSIHISRTVVLDYGELLAYWFILRFQDGATVG
jgi:hypothetical protein